MRIDRRRALALLGLGAAAPATAQTPAKVSFDHGVASGDPLQDRVVIWTRISGASGQVPYRWRLGEKSGSGVTGPERDHTVKVDVTGLEPGRDYRFRFEAAGVTSPEGRTRTLPAAGVRDVVLAVASCTLFPNGYFNAYRAIADLPRVDAVLHLGDYLYEYGGPGSYGMNSAVGAERPHHPNREIVSLADYRTRHAQYKADPDLQAAHARAPWIVAWDDHETANDSFSGGAENHSAATEGDWNTRKAAGLKAYFEWMPIREPGRGRSHVEAAQRAFVFGDLASLIMVETRLGARDRQLTHRADLMASGQPDVAGFKAKLNDPARRMMSPAQEAWIGGELARSVKAGHVWQVIGNQVIMARVDGSAAAALTQDEAARVKPEAKRRLQERSQVAALGVPAALDMWDGYPVDRERLYGLFRQTSARPVVVSGDSHSFWANELHDQSGRRIACEFGTTGITSPGAGELAPGLDWGEVIARANKEVRYNNQSAKGFVLLTLTREEARADMMAVSTITARSFTTATLKTFRVKPDGSGVSPITDQA
jgi:alkaline phosphatase D